MADLLANEDVDAVSVLTPSGMHRDNALEVMEAGKHVLVEKPIALRPDQVVEMAAMARERGLHAFVVKQNRFNKPVLQLRRAIDDGRLKRLVTNKRHSTQGTATHPRFLAIGGGKIITFDPDDGAIRGVYHLKNLKTWRVRKGANTMLLRFETHYHCQFKFTMCARPS